MKYDIKRAVKANLLLIWFFALFLPITAFINDGLAYGIQAFIATGSTAFLATILFFLPIPIMVKSQIMVIIPFVASLLLSITGGGVARMFNLYILSFAMQALYFNYKTMAFYGGGAIFVLIAMFLVNPSLILDPGMGIGEFVPRIGAMISVSLVLVLLTKWGGETVKNVERANIENQESLSQLTELFEGIKRATDKLEKSSSFSKNKMEDNTLMNEEITMAMGELSKSVEEAAQQVEKINYSTKNSSEDITKTSNSMDELKTSFKELYISFGESAHSMTAMQKVMNIINSTVIENHTAMEELSNQMGRVQESLNGIKSIADQTNLLALNASIEAARAGDEGKGFAVVAEEIRKLSQGSNKIAEEIYELISQLIDVTQKAKQGADSGIKAVGNGEESMILLNRHFTGLEAKINVSEKVLTDENARLYKVSKEFKLVEEAISDIAAVLEENSAHFQEISSKVDVQNESTHEINEEMKKIDAIGKDLSRAMRT